MRAGLDRLEATGTRGSLAHLFMLMAELYAGLGAVQEGERAIDRALALADETGARSNLAEMYRVQGMLRRRQKEIEAAEASFMRAITVAQEQTARLWELRAVMSLCRLRQAEGPRAAFAVTCQQLADLYAWFNEGFDTADLQEAAALLAEGGLLKDACLETE
jgi:adenylate cyclase